MALFKGIKDYKDLYEGKIKDLPDRKAPKPEEPTENTPNIENVIIQKQEVSDSQKTQPVEETKPAIEFPKPTVDNKTEEQKPVEIAKPLVLTDDSIFFKVQIAISKEKIANPTQKFKGIKNINENYVDNLYKYYVGNTTNYQKALELQREIRKNIADAFIVAFQNDKKIPINEALKKIKH